MSVQLCNFVFTRDDERGKNLIMGFMSYLVYHLDTDQIKINYF